MADDASNDDQWLYGDAVADAAEEPNEERGSEPERNVHGEQPQDVSMTEPAGQEQEGAEPPPVTEESEEKNEGEIDDDDDDDDSDDDVNVVIGDIKATPATYSSLNIKRGGLLTSAVGIDKLKQPGKFSIEEFEQIGTINGIPAHEFNVDSLEDKPWRKPGADITDYFNYGFNEDTWRAYCERQKRMRIHESGVGLGPLGNTMGPTIPMTGPRPPGAIPVAIINDNSKYNAPLGIRKAGPPPGRKMAGSIDVIGSGGGTLASRRTSDRDTPPKENVIQVMTADRREYSRKNPGFPDVTVPPPTGIPPTFDVPPPIPVPSPFPPPPARMHPPYGQDQFYSPDADPYYQSYEPTQEQQWGGHTEPLPGMAGVGSSVKPKDDSKDSPKSSSRDRERDRERTERGDRDKDKHRSHRHRSRSRSPSDRKSRRHKSRSRSPGHRSHRKKKSKKSDKSKEEDSD